MVTIEILTSNLAFKKGFNDFFPLIKWEDRLKAEGIKINFISKPIRNCGEILVVDYRFLQTLYSDRNIRELENVKKFVLSLRNHYKKLILFDSGDGTSSRAFWLTPYFDLHVKKQVLKNKLDYTKNNGDKSLMPWIPDNATPSNIPYKALDVSHVHKIKLGWNIGMLDYRYFPLKKYYPIGTSALFNNHYKELPFVSPDKNRKYITTYRGGVSKDTRYSCQRSLTIQVINNLKTINLPVATGGKVSLHQFIKELKSSHIAISPYGWGEICYRDFEAVIYGNILVKPDMSHLDTYPDIFLPMETYVPVSWNMSDLPESFDTIIQNLADYKKIAHNAQRIYREIYHDEKRFIKQLKSAFEI